MGLNNAFEDKTRYGVTSLGLDQFLICQTGGGWQGKYDSNGLVYYQWSRTGKATVNDELGGGDLTSAPAVVHSSYKTHVAARGTDGNIWYKSSPSGAWEQLPSGSLTSAPAICVEGNNVHIFARALDNQLWHTYKEPNAGWIGWRKESIPDLPGGMKSAPSVAVNTAGRFDVVAQGNDNKVWHLTYAPPAGWSQWNSLGGSVNAAPTCCWWGASVLHVFARGDNNQVWHKYFDWSGGFGNWHNPLNPADHSGWGNDVPAHPNGGIMSAPVAVAGAAERVDIFAGGVGAEVWSMAWTSATGWQEWKPVHINSA